jgi:hypothetical protein
MNQGRFPGDETFPSAIIRPMRSLTLWRSLAAVLAALAAFLAWRLWSQDTSPKSAPQQPKPRSVASKGGPAQAAVELVEGQNPWPAPAGQIQLSSESALRLFKKHLDPVDGSFPGALTWDRDVLALLGISAEAIAKLDDAIRIYSTKRLRIIKSVVRQETGEAGTQIYRIPDWSAQGEGLHSAFEAAVVEALGTTRRS